MDMLETMLSRRSIRKYKDEPVCPEKLQAVLDAALSSATGKGKRPWELVVVKDKEQLKKLALCRQGAGRLLEGAAVGIAVIGDKELSDTWIEDCSIVMANMHLMAHAQGLGSCWIQGRNRQGEDGRTSDACAKELLGYPDNFELLAFLAIGVPDEEKPAYKIEDLHLEKLHIEEF